MSFPGTEHYRERIELFEQVLEKKKPNDLLADAQIMVSWMRTLCDHIEEQDKEIERLRKENENCCMVAAEAIGREVAKASLRTQSSEEKP